jgi:benzylsuccinate CoA-transferase BbsE subunit
MSPDERDATGPTESRPCAGVRVLDATGPYGAYAARLLADLGADVLRIVPPDGDPLDRHPPLVATPDGGSRSAFGWFVNLNKRSVRLDLDDPADRVRLGELLADVDVLLESWTNAQTTSAGLADIVAAHPHIVQVSITPFGHGGPWTDRSATDLTSLASGGLLALGGYPDGEPVAAYGDQSLLAASIFGAVAALTGLVARQRDGSGRHLDVSAQEAVSAALEDAIPQFDLTGRIRRRAGGDPREAGTGILACRDGYVSMVAGRLGTAKAWTALTRWLVEEGVAGADELATEEWESFPFRQRPRSIARFQEIFERFAADKTKSELYVEAQLRNIALAPVNAISDVLADPQLAERGFFRSVDDPDLGHVVRVPGRPYRLAGSSGPTPRPMAEPESAPKVRGATVLDEGAA